MSNPEKEQLKAIHQVLNEEPNGAEGDKRAIHRIREALYGKAPLPVEPGDDSAEQIKDLQQRVSALERATMQETQKSEPA